MISQLQNASLAVYFSDKGDLECEGYTLEIGGKQKLTSTMAALKQGYVFADGILTGFGRKRPLYLLGFLT